MENKSTAYLKKLLRYVKYFAVSSVILILIEVAIGYWLISSRWSIFLTEGQMVRLSDEINTAKPLPEKFINLYDQLYPNVIHASMAEQLFVGYGSRILFRIKQVANLPHCSCVMIYDIQIKSNLELANAHWPGRLQELEYGFAIEKFSSPEKCFNFMVYHQIDNLKATSPNVNNLLAKDISSMNEDELTQLIMLLKGKDF